MRCLIACWLVFGVSTASLAQADSVAERPSTFSCFYIDASTFQCNLNESEDFGVKEKRSGEEIKKGDPSENDIVNPRKEEKSEEGNTEGGEDDIYDRPGVINDDLYLEDEVELDEGYDLKGDEAR